MQSNPDTALPRVLGRYQLIRQIGKGGMGTVYEAYHPILKKRFAIKTLLETAAAIPGARARFLREAEAAARINHPHVVHVTDVGSEGPAPYLVMEYLEGQTLAELLAIRGRLDPVTALDLLLPVMSAVAAAHTLGVIHRDLKPENIFLAHTPLGDVCPKVLDFGISKLTDAAPSTLTGPQATLGTAAYMSPEQARGARDVGVASDQYSLGLILYELVGGARAHRGRNTLETLHNISCLGIVRLRHLQTDCPQALEDAVMRMLSPVPEYRFPSVAEAGAALLDLASTKTRTALTQAFDRPGAAAPALDVAPPQIDRSELATRPAGRSVMRAWPVAVVSLLVVLLATLVLFAWLGRRVPLRPVPVPASLPAQRWIPGPAMEPRLPVHETAPAEPVASPLPPQVRSPRPAASSPAGGDRLGTARIPRSQRKAAGKPFGDSHREESMLDQASGALSRPKRGANNALIIE